MILPWVLRWSSFSDPCSLAKALNVRLVTTPPGFFRVAVALKKLNYTKPLAAEGPFTVRFLTLQNGSLVDHSDQIGPVECEDRSERFLRCRDDP